MALPFTRLWLPLALFFLTVVSRPALAQSDTKSAPSRTVEGIATTPAGKPLAHVTLYLFGLPPGLTDMITLGDQSTIVTDDQGHFIWAVPPALPPLSDYIGVRDIACYALAADRSAEQFQLALRPNLHGTDAEQGERSLLERATLPCQTQWHGGSHPIFSVTVPDTSAIFLNVRGPDGQPLRNREIQVIPAETPSVYGGAIVYTGRTDTTGRLCLRCFPGSLRLQIFVPGLGFGSTGTFDARPRQSGTAALPPLAPFATLSGTLVPTLVGPGVAIHLEASSNENDWYDPHTFVDANGRWVLPDILPGQHRLLLTGGQGESEPVWVTVQPGEQVKGLVIGPKQAAAEIPSSTGVLLDAAPAAWGRVLSADSKPVEGADVYAACSSFGGMRFRQTVLAAKTDSEGRYRIAFPALPAGESLMAPAVHLVAHLPGFGLAVADGQSEKGRASNRWTDVQQDLVLPAVHSALTVHVLQDGKPAPNILVGLTVQGENFVISPAYREADRGSVATDLRALLSPRAATGPDGVARFTDLTPGLWNVTANRTPFFGFSETTAPPSNVSSDIPARAGEDSSFTLSLFPSAEAAAFRIVGPNGLPARVVPKSIRVTTASDPNYGVLSLAPDSRGSERANFYGSGLFQVTARFGAEPSDANPLVGPYWEGTALAAVSPVIASRRPVLISTRRQEPVSIYVRLLDAQGLTLRGAVTVGDVFCKARYAASADANGMAIFRNLPPGKYVIAAYIAGRPKMVSLGQESSPLPSDAALIAGTSQPLPQWIVVRGGEAAHVILGAQSTGYVRLRLTGPFVSATGYSIEGRLPTDEEFVGTRFDPVSHEYLLGPLPPGRRTFQLFRYVPAPVETNLEAGQITVTVKAGQIVRAALTAQSTAAQELLYSFPLAGMVLLADGKTPAWGARVALFSPDQLHPLRMAKTDTQGRLTLKDYWRNSLRSWEIPPGNPAEPVLAAWLPGANGAVIAAYYPGQDQTLILPAPVSLHGCVTVGGQTALGLPSAFRVRAAYQGKGALNQVLTVETTAQADGTFTLAGLTPGTYQVQAARDNIWLSPTQTITVGADALPALMLDIAPPGMPVILKLEDGHGKTLPGETVKIVRPDGPLTTEIWPTNLISDNEGLLRLDGLEAGPHFAVIPARTKESIGFHVPAWTPDALSVIRRIVLPFTSGSASPGKPRRG